MRTTAVATVPTSAERIRSACIRGQALLAIADRADAAPVTAPVCHLMSDGNVVVTVPVGDPVVDAAAGSGVPAMLELTDHAPLRLRERVRALAWIRGLLRPVPGHEIPAVLDRIAAVAPDPALLQVVSPRSAGRFRDTTGPDGNESEITYTLLRLSPESAVLADATGAEAVDVRDLLAARPDPFCAIEAHWLQHLDSAHPEMVARLAAAKLPPQLRRGQVRPLAVDRYGIWLRVEAHDEDRDVRLTFLRPVADVSSLNRAVRALLGCPFLNGLHPRRPTR
ncbi:DUF2470 domain-containing protein [Mycolicibacter hiberniae]|uniref:DUF2470 domain-containing protein n=1 Tax=Mycolicibacter hiberniae TaxID=29314 RepID=A0A7I7X9N9_9MYCO|nr:DUF2470 domain-containing protein [Mycolicibacter hiberniae]MCV7087433.1 DUF2470 domain-containing protein [Mycolicibacter hiberniae]ORV69016.1 prephenate dehydratase [Mycolicibacter hiberniae]BBZ25048.1 hypothetical protein MHIB_34660 [Mycolicibacter hiberniae]